MEGIGACNERTSLQSNGEDVSLRAWRRKKNAARQLLPSTWQPVSEEASAFAPVNIALAKYWGKRDEELHLPLTDSFSVALDVGTTTTIRRASSCDEVVFNGSVLAHDSPIYQRLVRFLDLVRPTDSFSFFIHTTNAVPTAAGLASSASGFAALALALNGFFGWNLDRTQLSCLARLGSGSACRSVYSGFVKWQKGSRSDGRDSYAVPFDDWWPELRLAVLLLSSKEKPISSSEAMRRTVETSPVYELWSKRVEEDMAEIIAGVRNRDFSLFGRAVERNALTMHATMHTSWPPVCYWLEETVVAMKKIWKARENGVEVYFTMDAGPNIKLLFLEKTAPLIEELFPQAQNIALVPS
jgi:diphosphomevalonate decarboxylase